MKKENNAALGHQLTVRHQCQAVEEKIIFAPLSSKWDTTQTVKKQLLKTP